jgi:SAM-dependent methyltransferase
MHRPTIEAYDADAQHWLDTRYRGETPALPFAAQFRADVGEGLILDVGCGPGQLLEALGSPMIGIDASVGMLAVAEQFAGAAPLLQADAEALPIRDGAAAGAFASFSLQHLPRSGFTNALRQLRRALQMGGLIEIAMHDRNAPNLKDQPDGVRANDDVAGGRWFTYWTADEVTAELVAAGFAVVEVQNLVYANRYRAQAG